MDFDPESGRERERERGLPALYTATVSTGSYNRCKIMAEATVWSFRSSSVFQLDIDLIQLSKDSQPRRPSIISTGMVESQNREGLLVLEFHRRLSCLNFTSSLHSLLFHFASEVFNLPFTLFCLISCIYLSPNFSTWFVRRARTKLP